MKETDPRSSRSRVALLESGIEILSTNPRASLSEIAARAGVGRATLYRHFETREQLLVELATESLTQTDNACSHILDQGIKGREALEEIFTAVIPLGNRFHFLLSLWGEVSDNKELMKIYKRQLSQVESRIKEAKTEKSIDKSLPNEWLISLMDNLVYTGWYCIGTKTLSARKASKFAIRSFFDGVGTKSSAFN